MRSLVRRPAALGAVLLALAALVAVVATSEPDLPDEVRPIVLEVPDRPGAEPSGDASERPREGMQGSQDGGDRNGDGTGENGSRDDDGAGDG